MELLKFISSRITSKVFLDKILRRFSGFFSVTISCTSGRNKRRTAVKTSMSSSITETEAVFNCIYSLLCKDESTTMPSIQDVENEHQSFSLYKGLYQNRTYSVRKRTSS